MLAILESIHCKHPERSRIPATAQAQCAGGF
jgi:hypothetical protein